VDGFGRPFPFHDGIIVSTGDRLKAPTVERQPPHVSEQYV
jgi:hypothetical protein